MTRALISLRNRVANRNDDGATAVEYGLMVSLIAVVIIAAVTAIGVALNGTFGAVAGAL
jgi:pilus assembly protein Flp/PilA